VRTQHRRLTIRLHENSHASLIKKRRWQAIDHRKRPPGGPWGNYVKNGAGGRTKGSSAIRRMVAKRKIAMANP
jgi:hypothetical protein